MIINQLTLKNFRNHTNTEVEWGKRLNIITGSNGAGKTNLIDAIHYLCMSRSFVSTTDQYVLQFGEKELIITGKFSGSIRSNFQVTCSYSRGNGKKILINDSPLDKLSDLIGMVPVVVLSPDDKKLTSEGPSERRSFLDSFISQLSKSYLKDLIEYRRVIKQRNTLLSNQSLSQSALRTLLEPWDEQLIRLGSKITVKRAEILHRFSIFLEQGYELIAGIGHRPKLEYKAFTDEISSIESLETAYREALSNDFARERDRQLTLTGPHRDDITFYLDDMELRKFGSQGQHRLFALALKIAQRNFYEHELDDLPIFLLDDVFGDLDPHKTNVLVEMLTNQSGQTFITSANKNLFVNFVESKEDEIHYYEVDNGLVTMTTSEK
ncbi:MAG TPA: DNA replication and repair protein RecF [Bacteroidetes bacterium]|nr:DNA replication and repair protein RecF [Bacteroidota bacterium]